MAERVMLTVICYDIVETRIRARVAAVLEEEMARVQDSVFEARLAGAAAAALFARARALLAPGDSLRMYAVGAAGLERSRAHGGAPILGDGDFWLV